MATCIIAHWCCYGHWYLQRRMVPTTEDGTYNGGWKLQRRMVPPTEDDHQHHHHPVRGPLAERGRGLRAGAGGPGRAWVQRPHPRPLFLAASNGIMVGIVIVLGIVVPSSVVVIIIIIRCSYHHPL